MPTTNNWTLPLEGFKATSTNYTIPDPKVCLVCRNYDEIDSFARAITLDKLQKLCDDTRNDADFNTANDPFDPSFFDARVLITTLKAMTLPTDPGLNKILKDRWLTMEKAHTLKSIFSIYATFPIKNDNDLSNHEAVFGARLNELNQENKEAKRNNDTAKMNELDAKVMNLLRVKAEDESLYQWIKTEGRPGHVDLIASTLWSSFVKAKYKAAGYDTSDNAQEDFVAKARLFYTWLSSSITYDDTLALKLRGTHGHMFNDRPVADILYTNKEVCKGFADMFVQMFNGSHPKEPALYLSGLSRQGGGSPGEKWGSSAALDTAHAWCAFPTRSTPSLLNPQDKNPLRYKVIDPTWAMVANSSQPNYDPWFSMTNSSMSLSHIPRDNIDLAFLPPGTFIASPQELWDRSQPHLPSEGYAAYYWIDLSTIDPMSSGRIHPQGQHNEVTVTFRNNCEHQGSKMPDFYLGFRKTDDNLENFLKSPFDKDIHEQFKPEIRANTAPWRWKATIKIPKQGNGSQHQTGWVFVYSATGGFVNMFQKHSRVAMWEI